MVRIPFDESPWHARCPVEFVPESRHVLRWWDELVALEDGELQRVLVSEEDPLFLHEFCFDGLEAEGFLLDHLELVERLAGWIVAARSAVRSAQEAVRVLPDLLTAAMRRQVESDAERVRAGDPLPQPLPGHLQALVRRLGLPEERTLEAASALNHLPWKLRHPLWHALLMGKGYAGYLRQYGTSSDDAGDRIFEGIARIQAALTGGPGGRP